MNSLHTKGMITALLDDSKASPKKHDFFRQFRGTKTPDQIKHFAVQWFFAARNHKRAFPFFVGITQDDFVRCKLIEVLRDEYGKGDPTKIHGVLLKQLLIHGLKMSTAEIEQVKILPGVEFFSKKTFSVWQDLAEPIKAFGYHFALEYIAEDVHAAFAEGLKGNNFSDVDLAYFNYHKVAEKEHASIAGEGLEKYAHNPENRTKLIEGAQEAIYALIPMWDDMESVMFQDN